MKHYKRGTFTPIWFVWIDGRLRAVRCYDAAACGRVMFGA